jgi:hypothetical protein
VNASNHIIFFLKLTFRFLPGIHRKVDVCPAVDFLLPVKNHLLLLAQQPPAVKFSISVRFDVVKTGHVLKHVLAKTPGINKDEQ